MAGLVEEGLAYSIIGIIWLSMALLLVMVWYLFPPEIYYWDKMCDNCTVRSALYRYVIRFSFGSFKPTFHLSTTTVTIEVLDTNNKSLVLIQMPPQMLDQSVLKPDTSNVRICRFLLYRREPLTRIKSLIINHSGDGSVNVITVEIQDVESNEANIAFIGQPISHLSADKAMVTQSYPAASKEMKAVETELMPNQTLNPLEFIVLFFAIINLTLLQCLYVIPCAQILCNNFKDGFLPALFTGLTASFITTIVFIVLCVVYRYGFKRCLYNSKGKGFKGCLCFCCRYLYLLLVIGLGIGSGGFAAYMASKRRRFKEENIGQLSHEILWLIGVGISIGVLFLFWVPILSIIAYLIGFFKDPADDGLTSDTTPTNLDKTMITQETAGEDKTSDYYEGLMKGQTKVKSISQYAGIAGHSAKPSKEKAKTDDKSKAKSDNKSLKNDSTGSGYYKQLMKNQGKVKSVSQYTGQSKK